MSVGCHMLNWTGDGDCQNGETPKKNCTRPGELNLGNFPLQCIVSSLLNTLKSPRYVI